jgi:hypothetical protein
VCLLPPPVVRLKRPLSLHGILYKPRLVRTVNRSERVQQVSIMVDFVLQSATFTVRLCPNRPHGCLVSSRSFPHLWKKLWKITILDDSSLLWPYF